MTEPMDDQQQALARACLAGAEAGTSSFPQIVGALTDAGFDGYAVDFRRGAISYFLPDGVFLDLASHAFPVAAAFDGAVVRGAIGEAQRGDEGYSYPAFCSKVAAAGCAGYLVSFPGRWVLYYGRSGETHTEHFPNP